MNGKATSHMVQGQRFIVIADETDTEYIVNGLDDPRSNIQTRYGAILTRDDEWPVESQGGWIVQVNNRYGVPEKRRRR